jgi:hypothetical protein
MGISESGMPALILALSATVQIESPIKPFEGLEVLWSEIMVECAVRRETNNFLSIASPGWILHWMSLL